MTGPDDDVWIDMQEIDPYLAEGIWEGAAPPDESPAWHGEVATLVRQAATMPPTADELAGEAGIVALMQRALGEAAAERAAGVPSASPVPTTAFGVAAGIAFAGPWTDPGGADGDAPVTAGSAGAQVVSVPTVTAPVIAASGAHAVPAHAATATPRGEDAEQGRIGRVVGRIVAVKAVAATTAVAIGITAAAATTGIVAKVVVPTLNKNDDPPAEAPAVSVSDGSGGGSSSSDGSGDRSDVRSPDTSTPGATTPTTAAPGQVTSTTASALPGEAGGDPTSTDATTADGEPVPSTTSDTTVATDPPPTSTIDTTTSTSTPETPPTTDPVDQAPASDPLSPFSAPTDTAAASSEP